jgi:hypothetical protein
MRAVINGSGIDLGKVSAWLDSIAAVAEPAGVTLPMITSLTVSDSSLKSAAGSSSMLPPRSLQADPFGRALFFSWSMATVGG